MSVPSSTTTFGRPSVEHFVGVRTGTSNDPADWTTYLGYGAGAPDFPIKMPYGEAATRIFRYRKRWDSVNALEMPHGKVTAYMKSLARTEDDVDPTGTLVPYFDSDKTPATPTQFYIDATNSVVSMADAPVPASSVTVGAAPFTGTAGHEANPTNHVSYLKPSHTPGISSAT